MKLKKSINIFIILSALFATLLATPSVWAYTILIDPGHGGEEHGASVIHKGKTIYEKDLSLAYAKSLYQELSRFFSTYLTRSYDKTVSLQARADLAEKIKADLVISIHFNSFSNSTPKGYETYYLDNHKDGAVQKVENIENKGLAGEDLVINQILIDLVIQKTVDTSKKLAIDVHTSVLKELKAKNYSIPNRKVRPGLFYLLALSKRPGMLIEVGFMSNPKELERLLNEKFRQTWAQAMAKALVDFAKANKKLTPAIY
jgi:N-acetylmuramoyl-L-alanine amidase